MISRSTGRRYTAGSATTTSGLVVWPARRARLRRGRPGQWRNRTPRCMVGCASWRRNATSCARRPPFRWGDALVNRFQFVEDYPPRTLLRAVLLPRPREYARRDYGRSIGNGVPMAVIHSSVTARFLPPGFVVRSCGAAGRSWRGRRQAGIRGRRCVRRRPCARRHR